MVVILFHGPLTRYVKLRGAHALGMPGTFSPPPRVSDPDMLHGTCVTHVPWCMPGSPTSGFPLSRWRGKRSRHSRRMRNAQFYVSGKRPMGDCRLDLFIPGADSIAKHQLWASSQEGCSVDPRYRSVLAFWEVCDVVWCWWIYWSPR